MCDLQWEKLANISTESLAKMQIGFCILLPEFCHLIIILDAVSFI